ncbi:hypothetical protein DFH28DRAFT_1120793 [Melampsora americana]|nr:hypothetical protein DFH28DRAFT_1120793 [Melampsora americana]
MGCIHHHTKAREERSRNQSSLNKPQVNHKNLSLEPAAVKAQQAKQAQLYQQMRQNCDIVAKLNCSSKDRKFQIVRVVNQPDKTKDLEGPAKTPHNVSAESHHPTLDLITTPIRLHG